MKIILLLICLSFLGCKSKRILLAELDTQSTQSIQSDIREVESIIRDSTGTRTEETTGTDERTEDSETEIRVTEYDTSKPVDEHTGRPPVARETVTTSRTKYRDTKSTLERQTEEGVISEQTNRDVKASISAQSSEASTSELRETRERKTIGWLWWLAGGIVVVVLGLKIKRK